LQTGSSRDLTQMFRNLAAAAGNKATRQQGNKATRQQGNKREAAPRSHGKPGIDGSLAMQAKL